MSQTFPTDFMCIGDRSFEWVYQNRPEFVEFTLTEMSNPTGLFLEWQEFCKAHGTKFIRKTKHERVK